MGYLFFLLYRENKRIQSLFHFGFGSLLDLVDMKRKVVSLLLDEIYKDVAASVNTDGSVLYVEMDNQGDVAWLENADANDTRPPC